MVKTFDVAIIGGGPAGSTAGSLLRLYSPNLSVAILERECFPREHVGESQLPAISHILDEMGVWDRVEAAGFPIKVGATYRWGRTTDLWDLDFLLDEGFVGTPRPSRFEGQRRMTAFQVDRSIYDKILLDHAKDLGCEVFEETRVARLISEGDTVLSLEAISTDDSKDRGGAWKCEARHYVDASGDSGLIRRAMGVETDSPTSLRNIAIWDYWDDVHWAVSLGHGGTLAQIMSLGWGWIWFFPISPTRASVGLVMPADRYKERGRSTEDTYMEAISQEPLITKLLADAKRRGNLRATKDWSFLADRIAGENWFLVGDSCGFADPILSAGMTLAHLSARKVAYAILELELGKLDKGWIKRDFDESHRANIRHHIQFADFWYSANGCFTDLKEYCSQIARDAGLELTADAAFHWLGAGGFAGENLGEARALSYRLSAIKALSHQFTSEDSSWAIGTNNVFRLCLDRASEYAVGMLKGGRITPIRCLRRGGKVLPLAGYYLLVFSLLQTCSDATDFGLRLDASIKSHPEYHPNAQRAAGLAIEALEAMITEGWVAASLDKSRPILKVPQFREPKFRNEPEASSLSAKG